MDYIKPRRRQEECIIEDQRPRTKNRERKIMEDVRPGSRQEGGRL
jgi:hypothetical protein